MDKKIFIIEDDANILAGLQAKLSLQGLQVDASNGNIGPTELLANIKKFKPNYIVLDLLLPKVDGLDFLKILKADEETSNIAVFIFTNLSDNDSKEKGINLGAKQYFVKNDFSMDDFVEKITKIIKNNGKME